MPTFNIYQQPGAQTSLAKKWFFRALILSLLIHAALFAAFRSTKLETLTPYTARLVPRNFSLTRVAVDESVLSDQSEQKPDAQQNSNTQLAVPTVNIPKESPTVDNNPPDVVFKPNAPELIATENPKTADSGLKSLEKMQQSVSKELDNDLNKVSDQLINDKSQTSSKTVVKFADSGKAGAPGNSGDASAIPGTKSLDEALSSTGGGLQSGDKIGIRGGALFAFDSADLLPGAMDDLKKLAAKLQEVEKHHPKAAFVVEGYADSIGANTDPQYNKDLSQRRADAVMDYLETMGVDRSRIQAVGNGSTDFIDPPTYDPAKQALEPDNRRVEIVVTFQH